MSRTPRIAGIIVGVIAILIGGLWIGQGAGVIGGSFMTGSTTWLSIGIVALVAGIFLIWLAVRRPRGDRG